MNKFGIMQGRLTNLKNKLVFQKIIYEFLKAKKNWILLNSSQKKKKFKSYG